MDDDLRERVERAAEEHALFNALKHGTDPEVGAVMGPLMGENPDFRPHGDEVPGVVASVAQRVADLSEAERRDRLDELAPDRLAELDADPEPDDDDALPALPGVKDGDEVVMRAAPNPNGPWHLGHARMPAVIGTYTDEYDGRFLVRFDDTDPETKRPSLDAYDAILEDIAYLGFEPDEVLYASDRLETYYEHARELIDAGGAYTCSCPAEEFSRLKNNGDACPHRDQPVERTHEEFDRMVAGEFSAGERVLRVRTDIDHPNPALRDWVAFRMIDTPHPREAAADYRCWPMLDFQSGIDDYLTGVTHIVRGIDLQDSAKRQQFVYDYFDWTYPEVLHWGKVNVDAFDVKLSTSTLKQLVDAGELDGWDDPRAPTLAAVRRRGIRGAALVDAMVELGLSTSDVDLAMSSVYAHNRELIDDEAPRYFLVRDETPAEEASDGARQFDVEGGPDAGHPPVHPDHDERGRRDIPVDGAVLVEPGDVPEAGDRVWLKGFGCVRRHGGRFEYTGDEITAVREEGVPVIHWVPARDNRPVRLRTPDGDVSGFAEPGFADAAVDDVVQFERVGFARVDDHRDDESLSVAYFTHD
jgi:glutamyl-tRNA synthetase